MDADQKQINAELRRTGLGSLDDPNIVQSMAFLIRTHDHFRQVLLAVDPENRRMAYQALSPHLRFRPKTVDQYEMEGARLAEEAKKPTFDSATGTIKEFDSKPIEIRAMEAIQQSRIARETKGSLSLVCKRCTKEGVFPGKNRKECAREAVNAGWRQVNDRDLCPECAAN